MRPAFPLLALILFAPAASAQDARVVYLSKQLKTGDFRLRVNAAATLAATGSADAVGPLCETLKDPDVDLRTAVATALGELGQLGAQPCLKAALTDADNKVKAAAQRALDKLATALVPGSLYFSVDDVKSDVGDDASKLAAQLLRQKLTGIGGVIAPAGESKTTAAALVKNKKLRAFLLRPAVTPEGGGLKFEILVMTYPDQALQGSFNVKGKGGKPDKLLKAMVPRVIDDAADELKWKEQ